MRDCQIIKSFTEESILRTVRAGRRGEVIRAFRSMFSTAGLLLIVLLACADTAGGAAAVPWNGTAEIQFFGTSTLHNFSGCANCKPFTVYVTTDGEGRPRNISARAEVPAATMNTANRKRDAKMLKSMRIEDFPLIAGSVDGIPFEKLTGDGSGEGLPPVVTLPFTFELLGRKHAIRATVKNWRLSAERADCEVAFSLSLKACGITVPSIAGIIRVGDTIDVRATVSLVREKDE